MAANFDIPTETISVRQGSFTVRGLNSEDVVFLTSHYLEDLKRIVAEYGVKHAVGGVLPRAAVAELVMDIAQKFPMMSAEIISRCAEASEEIDKFRRLSFVKQIEALKAIAILSVEDGHDLKKAGEVLASLLEANGLQLGPLAKSLQTIIRTAESRLAT